MKRFPEVHHSRQRLGLRWQSAAATPLSPALNFIEPMNTLARTMTQNPKKSPPTLSPDSSGRPLRFRSIIKINNINPYILVTARQAARLKKNWRKPLPVRIRVNGQPKTPWRINMMPIGDGGFYLYLHGNVRKASNTSATLSAWKCNLTTHTRTAPCTPCRHPSKRRWPTILARGKVGTR
jgi:hypothetical protein